MTKHWEDDYIFGSRGHWYVLIDDVQAGYFYRIAAARAFVRKVLQ